MQYPHHHNRTLQLSFFTLVTGISVVLWSWSFFWWMSSMATILVTPLWLLMLFFAGRVSSRRFRSWRFHPSGWGLLLLITLTLSLALAAPYYSRWYGLRNTDHMFRQLGLAATLEQQRWSLVSWFGDLGGPRYIRTVYKLHDSPEQADRQVRARLSDLGGWRLGKFNGVKLWATCPPGEYFANTILIEDDGDLVLRLYHPNNSAECLLQ